MANFNFNKVILGGRLTADPELKQTQSGIAVVSFSIAVNRRYSKSATQQSETDFFNVTAWRQTAEFVTRYFSKGSMIAIQGHIQTRMYEDKNGNKRTSAEIVAQDVYFADSKKSEEKAEENPFAGNFAALDDEDMGLPF